MNEKAKELGLVDTHFQNQHGLDLPEHYTTAKELAIITNYALKNPKFASIVNTKFYTVTINGYSKAIDNTNELLGVLNGVYGVKTGFTNGANRCLVTATKRGDLDIICVVLGADTKKFRTKDSVTLIEYAFANYKIIDIQEKITQEFEQWSNINKNRIFVNKGVKDNVQIYLDKINIQYLPVKKVKIYNLNINFDSTTYLESPVQKDYILGNCSVVLDDVEIMNIKIKTKESIAKKDFFDYIKEFASGYTNFLEYNFI